MTGKEIEPDGRLAGRGAPRGPFGGGRRLVGLLVAAALVAVIGLLLVFGGEPSGRAGEIGGAFQKAQPCGASFVVKEWDSSAELTHDASTGSWVGSCGPWMPGGYTVAWAEFASSDDAARAVRGIRKARPPYCATATEVFLVDLPSVADVREFCREVGASEPAGQPLR